MAYRVKAYTLREESTESGTRYFISFKDGQGKSHELEVSEQFLYGVSADGTQEQESPPMGRAHREFRKYGTKR